jgi:putative transposase
MLVTPAAPISKSIKYLANSAKWLNPQFLLEFLFSHVCEIARRVRCWQGGAMILRWTAAGVLEAERNFRRIAGYRALAKLDAPLRAHNAAIDRGLDNRKQTT